MDQLAQDSVSDSHSVGLFATLGMPLPPSPSPRRPLHLTELVSIAIFQMPCNEVPNTPRLLTKIYLCAALVVVVVVVVSVVAAATSLCSWLIDTAT